MVSAPHTQLGTSTGDRGRAEQVGPVGPPAPAQLLPGEQVGVCSVSPGSVAHGWEQVLQLSVPALATFPEPSQVGAPLSLAALPTEEVQICARLSFRG